jgi:hypothetical protein
MGDDPCMDRCHPNYLSYASVLPFFFSYEWKYPTQRMMQLDLSKYNNTDSGFRNNNTIRNNNEMEDNSIS